MQVSGQSNASTQIAPDFKTQVQQFLNYENNSRHIPVQLRSTSEQTMFTVFFGLWELLEYSKLDKDNAVMAIDNSIKELFRGLDELMEKAGPTLRVVIPYSESLQCTKVH